MLYRVIVLDNLHVGDISEFLDREKSVGRFHPSQGFSKVETVFEKYASMHVGGTEQIDKANIYQRLVDLKPKLFSYYDGSIRTCRVVVVSNSPKGYSIAISD